MTLFSHWKEGRKNNPHLAFRRRNAPTCLIFSDCLLGVLKLSADCLEGVLRVSGRCLKGVWRESMGCLNGILVSQDW